MNEAVQVPAKARLSLMYTSLVEHSINAATVVSKPLRADSGRAVAVQSREVLQQDLNTGCSTKPWQGSIQLSLSSLRASIDSTLPVSHRCHQGSPQGVVVALQVDSPLQHTAALFASVPPHRIALLTAYTRLEPLSGQWWSPGQHQSSCLSSTSAPCMTTATSSSKQLLQQQYGQHASTQASSMCLGSACHSQQASSTACSSYLTYQTAARPS